MTDVKNNKDDKIFSYSDIVTLLNDSGAGSGKTYVDVVDFICKCEEIHLEHMNKKPNNRRYPWDRDLNEEQHTQ